MPQTHLSKMIEALRLEELRSGSAAVPVKRIFVVAR
jgi:hypothetical protein